MVLKYYLCAMWPRISCHHPKLKKLQLYIYVTFDVRVLLNMAI